MFIWFMFFDCIIIIFSEWYTAQSPIVFPINHHYSSPSKVKKSRKKWDVLCSVPVLFVVLCKSHNSKLPIPIVAQTTSTFII